METENVWGSAGEVAEVDRELLDRKMDEGSHKAPSWRPVTAGVPQGSIMAPIMFLVYSSDMPDRLTSKCVCR